jgi:transcriptional regulator with GAF, ATPase, and Fis domain
MALYHLDIKKNEGTDMPSNPMAYGSLEEKKNLILSLSSMFEGEFTLDWLEELTRLKASFILGVLEEESQNGLLKRIKPAVYIFKRTRRNEWIKDLSEEEKRMFHRTIATILMRELPGDDSIVLEIAHHLLQIKTNPTEAQWLMKAGEIFAGQLKSENAKLCFGHVVDSLSTQHGVDEDLLYIKAVISHSNGYSGRDQIEGHQAQLKQAKERAKKNDRQAYVHLLEMHIAKFERLNSEFNKSFKRFNHALDQLKATNDVELLAASTTVNLSFNFWQGRYRDVIEIYENTVPEVQNLPIGYFPVLVATMVGHSYAMAGQVTQGLGMLDSLYAYCLENKNIFLASHGSSTIANVMLSIGNIDSSLNYLKSSLKEADQSNNIWTKALVALMLSIIYFKHKNNRKKAETHFGQFLRLKDISRGNLLMMPYLLELSWLMKNSGFPKANEISIETEIERTLELKNWFIRGLAHRYQAMLGKLNGWPDKKVSRSFSQSAIWLKKAGGQIDCAKTHFELARHLLSQGNPKKAQTVTETAAQMLSSHETDLIPDDLRSLISEKNQESHVLSEIIDMTDHIAANLNDKKFLQTIITTVNRLTGAERGLLLLKTNGSDPSQLQLRVSKNFTIEQYFAKNFDDSRKMIADVILSGEGCIAAKGAPQKIDARLKEIIRSSICVPLIFKHRCIGALYHDNRMLVNVFKESDLKLLNYFASLAALCLEYENAQEEIERLHNEVAEDKFYHPSETKKTNQIEGMIGESRAFNQVITQIDQIAKTDISILLTGETGVGKNLVAQAIHRYSLRSKADLINVQCSSLTESLITSELFGHEKGAFTGAVHKHIGRFEMADGGTLFLDEIGELPLEVQARLLRVLQSKEFERVGGGKEIITSNFRLITATNRNLQQEVQAKRFREDLYYRINVFPIHIPPLRERREDIPQLVNHFLAVYNKKHGKHHDKIPRDVMNRLVQHNWPGNIRELENVIQRGVITSSEPYFQLPPLKPVEPESTYHRSFTSLAENEKKHIESALRRTGGKIHGPNGAAKILEINPSTLTSRMKKLGIKKRMHS